MKEGNDEVIWNLVSIRFWKIRFLIDCFNFHKIETGFFVINIDQVFKNIIHGLKRPEHVRLQHEQ